MPDEMPTAMGDHESFVSRAINWLLLDGNRLVVAGGVLVVALVLAFAVEPFPEFTGQNVQPLFYAFSALIGGNLNLLTIVVSINQLVLTRELKSPRKFRQEVDSISKLREDVKATTDEQFAPITPANFVRDLTDSMGEQADAMERVAANAGVQELTEDVDSLTTALLEDLAETRSALDQEYLPTDDVVIALLAMDFASLYSDTCRLHATYADRLSEDERAIFERLATQLQLLDVTREHYKQLFTRESLSNMSRIVLYVGVPIEVFMTILLVSFVGVFESTLPAVLTPGVVYTVIILGLAPLAVVASYVLRAATIARRTATTTQFTTTAEQL